MFCKFLIRRLNELKSKKLLSLLLVLALIASSISMAFSSDGDYTDVPLNHWGHAAIEKWSSDRYGVLVGNGTGKFNPNDTLTLAALATILSKTFGYAEQDTSISVTPTWAKDHIQKAVAAGVIPKEKSVDANTLLTREQVIKYLAIAYGISPASGDAAFLDKSDITVSCMSYVKAFQDKGYVTGSNSDPKKSMLYPAKSCTRTEILAIMDNMLSDIVESDINGQTYEKSLILRKGANLANTTVKGDLIIAQGVGDGHVELDNVIVKGKLIAYGGGENTIVIKGSSQIPSVIAVKAYGEPVRIKVQDGATVSEVVIAPFSSAIVNGTIAELVVDGDAKVTLQDAAVDTITVTDKGANVVVGSGSTVETLNIDGAATIKVDEGAKVGSATVTAGDVSIVGKGELANVIITKGADTGVRIDTTNTTIQNNSTFAVTNSNGTSVAPGESMTNAPIPTPTPTPTPNPTPPTGPAPGPSPDPGPSPAPGVLVATEADFVAAVENASINNITVTADITINGDVTLSDVTLTVNTGTTLTIDGLLVGTGYNTTLIINGTGRVNATDINNIGEGTYYAIGNGYWSKSISVVQVVLDEIKSKFAGTGNYSISYSKSTSTSPRVHDVISEYCIMSTYNQDTQSYDPVTVTLAESYTIPDGKDFYIGNNVTLVIPDGKTLTVDGNLRSNTDDGSSIIVESGGKVDLAQPSADLSEGTYIYTQGSWGKIAIVSDVTSFTEAVADTGMNAITVNGNITVNGDVTLRNSVTVTVKSGSNLSLTGQLKTLTVTGYFASLVIENGGTFSASGLTNLPADTYSGYGSNWCSTTWRSNIGDTWRADMQDKLGITQINGYGWSYKNPTDGTYLHNEISSYILEGYNMTLGVNYSIPGNAGFRLDNSTLTIPDSVTLTVGNDGIQGAGLSKIILQGTGNITGATTLSGEGTYIYANGQWVPEILREVKDASQLTSELSTTTPAGIVIHVTQDILDIGEDIIIPHGMFLVIDTGINVSTVKNIIANFESLYINGTLTILNGGNLQGYSITIGHTGTLTKTGTGSFATDTSVSVQSGGKLGSISPSNQNYKLYFSWDGTAWVQR